MQLKMFIDGLVGMFLLSIRSYYLLHSIQSNMVVVMVFPVA